MAANERAVILGTAQIQIARTKSLPRNAQHHPVLLDRLVDQPAVPTQNHNARNQSGQTCQTRRLLAKHRSPGYQTRKQKGR